MPANKAPQRLVFLRKRVTNSASSICCNTVPIRTNRITVDELPLSWRPSRIETMCCAFWRSLQRVIANACIIHNLYIHFIHFIDLDDINFESKSSSSHLSHTQKSPDKSMISAIGGQQQINPNLLAPNGNGGNTNSLLNATNSTQSSNNFYENTMHSDTSSLHKRKSVISSQSTGSSNNEVGTQNLIYL